MSLPRYAAQRDQNEEPIVKALLNVGAIVERMKQPVDLLVRFRAQVYVLEVDNPENKYRKRKKKQLEFIRDWDVPLVRTAEDALRAIGATN